MGAAWHAVLRDIMVILAAASLVVACLFGVLVAWRVYVIAREVRRELRPILDTVGETAETVRGSASFVRSGRVAPPVGAVGIATGAYRLVVLARQLARSARSATDGESENLGGD